MDIESPLVWAIGWLIIFGVVPLVLAAVLPYRGGPPREAAAALMTVALMASAVAATGPRNAEANETIIVFRPGMTQAAMMRAVLSADSQMKWTDTSGTVWAVDSVSWSGLAALHAHGALLVSSTSILAGCLAWTRRVEVVQGGSETVPGARRAPV